MFRSFLLAFVLLCCYGGHAQDSLYTREMLKKLCSEKCYGRGYLKGGLAAAEKLLLKQIKASKALPLFGKEYTQSFYQVVNTYPSKTSITLNEQALRPGIDYIPNANNRGISGTGNLVQKDSVTYTGTINGRVIRVKLKQKLTYMVGQKENEDFEIELDRTKFSAVPKTIRIDFENKLEQHFESKNVGCIVRGTSASDSVLVFSAHYDHLGGIGKHCYFPGANDNASGVSMLLNLLKYYTAHPPKYTTHFLFFAGEEAGLLGSLHYVQHPAIDLKKIKFLINLDLMGTGEEGIMVVNGAIYEQAFSTLSSINTSMQLLPQIKKRGKAANSDHYWFSEQGVPCFFMYTMGGIKAYHDVYDKEITLPLTAYKKVFTLLTEFVKTL